MVAGNDKGARTHACVHAVKHARTRARMRSCMCAYLRILVQMDGCTRCARARGVDARVRARTNAIAVDDEASEA